MFKILFVFGMAVVAGLVVSTFLTPLLGFPAMMGTMYVLWKL